MIKGKLRTFSLTAVFFVLIVSGGGMAFAQTGDQPAPANTTGVAPAPADTTGVTAAPVIVNGVPLNTKNKLRLQFEGYLGVGLDSSKIGVTNKGDDVKISGGGGAGLGLTLGYGFSEHFDIDATLGFQGSGLQPPVENAHGAFGRAFLLATAKYKIPVRDNLQWKLGLGAGLYQGKLDIDIDPGVAGAGHREIDYKSAVGVHATGELEFALRDKLTLSIGLKYYKVTYKADSSSFNGVSQPVSALPEEFRNFNGDGVDATAGFGILF